MTQEYYRIKNISAREQGRDGGPGYGVRYGGGYTMKMSKDLINSNRTRRIFRLLEESEEESSKLLWKNWGVSIPGTVFARPKNEMTTTIKMAKMRFAP